MDLFELLPAVSGKLLETLFFDYRFLPAYIIIGLVIKEKYVRYMDLANSLQEWPEKSGKRLVEEMVLMGLVLGFVTSIAAVGMRISITQQSLRYLLIILVLLVLINTRYACISYAGGILCLIGLIFNIEHIDVQGMLKLIAVLHFIESILIYMNGGRDRIPVFIKTKEGIAGAFLMQKFWPLPIVFLTMASADKINGIDGSWPVPGPEIIIGGVLMALDCIILCVGYSDIAITRTPERKSRESALAFLGYSVALFIISGLCEYSDAFLFVGAFFALLAHEGIILYGRLRERTGDALFKPVKRGLRVFDVLEGSHADKMGIEKGDVILSVNGKDVQIEEGLNEAIRDFPKFVWVSVVKTDGSKKTYEYRYFPSGLDRLGVVTVPREKEVTYEVDHFERLSVLKNLVARFKNKNIDKMP